MKFKLPKTTPLRIPSPTEANFDNMDKNSSALSIFKFENVKEVIKETDV